MNQLENWQAKYRSNTWMSRTRTDGPDEFERSKFDCMFIKVKPKFDLYVRVILDLPYSKIW